MTPTDYANIQRMIDQSILAGIGRELPKEMRTRDLQAEDESDYTGLLAIQEDVQNLALAVQKDFNRLENSVSKPEGNL
jgi:hypothetical protein